MDEISGRKKKYLVSQGVRRLRAQAGWDPAARQRLAPEQLLDALADRSNQSQAYAEASQCEACQMEREHTGDGTSLCENHLAEALGL